MYLKQFHTSHYPRGILDIGIDRILHLGREVNVIASLNEIRAKSNDGEHTGDVQLRGLDLRG